MNVNSLHLPYGGTLHIYNELDSTNAILKTLNKQGSVRSGDGVFAHLQTQGRGRHDRSWLSSKGNLHLSHIHMLSKHQKRTGLATLSLVAGLALYRVLNQFIDTDSNQLTLKWPNDMLIDDAKLAGILIETVKDSMDQLAVISGFGLNIMKAPSIEGIRTICLLDILNPQQLDALTIAQKLMTTYTHMLHRWIAHGFSPFHEEWLRYSFKPNQQITIKHHGEIITGNYQTVDTHGTLHMLDNTGKTLSITSSEIL